MNRAAFLDRDGTLVEERGYITAPDGIVLIPGAAGAIASLRDAGWKVIVVSNQGGIAQGLMTEEDLARVNARMESLLAAEGAKLDGIYCCIHHPEGKVPRYSIDCECRKPKPGMLLEAAAEHGVDLSRSVMIGDDRRDLEAGRAAGARAILVLTGKGRRMAGESTTTDEIVRDLAAAVGRILR